MELENSLRAFPPELLGNITCYLTLAEIYRLWLCGESILNTKFRNGGVTEVISEKSTSTAFVSQFTRLRNWKCNSLFSIDRSPASYISLLPPTLQQLTWDIEMHAINFGQLFPQLHSLSLSTLHLDEVTQPISAPLITFIVHRLPLKALELLPTSLTYLQMATYPKTPISSWLAYPLFIKEKDYFRFPHLKTLEIRACPPPMRTVPPTLTALTMSQDDSHIDLSDNVYDFRHLPTELETFTFTAQGEGVKLSAETIKEFFPSTLQRLTLVISDPFTDEHAKALPSDLKMLCMLEPAHMRISIDISDASFFPSSLTSLGVRVAEGRGRSLLDWNYPPHLKSLTVFPCHVDCTKLPNVLTRLDKVNLYPYQFCQLPSTLTKLSCVVFAPDEDFNKPWLGEDEVTPLPSNITSLQVTLWTHMTLHKWLPSNLKSLTLIGGENSPLPNDWLTSLPPSLTTVQFLNYFAVLNDRHLRPLKEHPSLQRFYFRRRPGAETPEKKDELTTKSLLYLPPSLESFEVSTTSSKMNVSHFAELPPHIHTIQFWPETRSQQRWDCTASLLDLLPPQLHLLALPVIVKDFSVWQETCTRLKIKDQPSYHEGFPFD